MIGKRTGHRRSLSWRGAERQRVPRVRAAGGEKIAGTGTMTECPAASWLVMTTAAAAAAPTGRTAANADGSSERCNWAFTGAGKGEVDGSRPSKAPQARR